MKRWAVAGAVATIVAVGAGTSVGAAPKQTVETFVCGTETVSFTVAGRNGWVNGDRYKAVQFTFEGGGFTDTKVYGGGKDLGRPDAFTCTQTFPEGMVTIVIVPA